MSVLSTPNNVLMIMASAIWGPNHFPGQMLNEWPAEGSSDHALPSCPVFFPFGYHFTWQIRKLGLQSCPVFPLVSEDRWVPWRALIWTAFDTHGHCTPSFSFLPTREAGEGFISDLIRLPESESHSISTFLPRSLASKSGSGNKIWEVLSTLKGWDGGYRGTL